MFKLIRHSTRHLRFWLASAMAILLFTSILEAGHVHGVFSEVDDHCTLCQHSLALDKTLTSSIRFITPLLLSLFTFTLLIRFAPIIAYRFALIRAPPVTLQYK